ncbi:autotransporter domain-containing protein, partial [Saccharibacter sp. EH611]|uniref:autotransporter outer membrane beta-barrel domain-containing protein n=3 Tax=unclassified Saccharibacter TaxID=2648722 RepID=UPI00132C2DF6
TVTGDVSNSGHLTLDGNTVAGTLSAQNGTFTVTNNNVAVGSLAGNGQGVLNGQLSVTNGHDTFGGDLSGAGTVQIDGGKQTFSGGNDYTGATTVARGTLALAQNGSIQKSAGVHVASDGSFDISGLGTGTTAVQALDGNGSVALGSKTLQLSNANAPFGNVYSGVISGDGSFNLTGGREILTGDSTYRGATQIAKGAQLVLGNNTTTGSLQSNTINVDGDLTINRSNRAVFNQTITGSGSLIQDGDGVTQLNGMSSYSGPTIVQRGGLDVEGALSGSDVQVNAGTLSGTGMAKSVTMERGSTFAPAGDGQIGTFSMGNGQNNALVMNDGSTLSIDVKGSSSLSAAELNDGLSTLTFQKRLYQVLPSDQIHVTGSAQIGNNVELSLPRGGTIKPGEAFTLVTSTNGVNGSFSGISGLNALSAFVKPEFIHSDDNKDLTLLLERNSLAFGDIGGTRNERATGTALDHVSVEKNVVQAMLSLNERDARQATNSLSGELHASARTALIQDSYYIRQAALDRLDSADCDGSSGNGIGTADLRTGQKTHQCLSDRPVLWGESYGSLGSNSGDGNATSLHHSAAGFVMGADAPVVAQWRVGGMVGYGHSMFNQKSGSSGSGHSDNITIGAYAGRNLGNISFKMGASYTWNLLSTRRTASVGSSYSSRLTSGYTGGTAQAFGEVGYKIHLNRTIIEPFANVAYVNQNTDSYHEHGGDAALRGRSMDTGVTFSTFGVRASSSFMIGKTQLTPHATVAYRRAYGVTTPTARELFASSSSSTMNIAGVPLSKDSAVVDTGITARLTDRINVDVSYIGQYGNQSVDSGARANINVQF